MTPRFLVATITVGDGLIDLQTAGYPTVEPLAGLMANDTGEGVLKELARFRPGIGWTRAARPTNAAPTNAAGKGGPSTRPARNVTDKGNGIEPPEEVRPETSPLTS